MNPPMGAKKSPEVKPCVRKVVEAAGVFMPANADGEQRLGWWGVEKVRSGTKDSRDTHSASPPALRGAVTQGLVGNRCVGFEFSGLSGRMLPNRFAVLVVSDQRKP